MALSHRLRERMRERMREDPVSEPFDPRQGWAPYAASALAAWAAIGGAWPLFMLPWFGPAMVAAVGVGIPVSMLLRSRRFHQYRVNLVVFGIAGILGALAATSFAEPLAAEGNPAMGVYFHSIRTPSALLIHLFVWVLAFHAYTLVTETELLLTVLPSMSVLIVVAVLVPGWQAYAWIALFAAAATVLFANDAESGLIARVARGHIPEERARRRQAAVRGAAVFAVAAPLAAAMALAGPHVDPVRRYLRQAEGWTDARLGWRLFRLIALLMPVEAEVPLGVDLGEQAGSGSQVVFRVRAPSGALYRDAVYARYRAGSWEVERGSPQFASEGPAALYLESRDPGRLAGVDAVPMRQVFRAGIPFLGVLYSAYEASEVVGPINRLRSYPGSALAAGGGTRLGRGATYTVVSMRKEPVEQADRVDARLSEEERGAYLQLPDSIPRDGRVARLAREVTAGLSDPYEKARAIASHLETNYRYIRRIDAPPQGAERVEYFLFSTKGAYCDYFASALVVMCRAVGVPARLVTGYRTDVPESDGWYVARRRDAHSWADVFVDGYGWTEMDPSPIGEAKTAAERLSGGLAAIGQAIKAGATWPLQALLRVKGLWWKGPLVLAVLLGLARGIVEWLREKPVRPDGRGADRDSLREYLVAAYRQMLRWLAAWGYPKAPADTAGEYAALVSRRAGPAAAPVEAIVDAYTAGRYTGAPRFEQAQQAAEGLAALLAARGRIKRAARQSTGGPA